jgi:hypothetical protein
LFETAEGLKVILAWCHDQEERGVIPSDPKRLVIDEQTSRVTLDDETFPIGDPGLLASLQRLKEAGEGTLVPTEELKKLPGCKGNLSRRLNRLLPPLRNIVKSKKGQGGGYWLRLPPPPVKK